MLPKCFLLWCHNLVAHTVNTHTVLRKCRETASLLNQKRDTANKGSSSSQESNNCIMTQRVPCKTVSPSRQQSIYCNLWATVDSKSQVWKGKQNHISIVDRIMSWYNLCVVYAYAKLSLGKIIYHSSQLETKCVSFWSNLIVRLTFSKKLIIFKTHFFL